MFKYSILSLLLICFSSVFCQDGDHWDVYMADYDGKPGSVVVNMDAIKNMPYKGMPFVVVTGTTFTKCREDGMPEKNAFDDLYKISDKLDELIGEATMSKLLGSFTFECERLNYYYVADTLGLRAKLSNFYEREFKDLKFYINIKPDPNWEYYTDFLYPNVETRQVMENEKVFEQLKKEGDKSAQARKVDHWAYFASATDRSAFLKFAESLGLKKELEELETGEHPYKLHFSGMSNVLPETLNELCIKLAGKAKELNGVYDGWETEIIK